MIASTRRLLPALLCLLLALPAAADDESSPPVDDAVIDRQMHAVLARLQEAEPERTIDHFLEAIGGPVDFEPRAPSAEAIDAVEIQRRLRRSVFVIGIRYQCENCTRWHLRTSSAFAVGPSHVVTNHHVVEKGGAAAVILDATGAHRAVIGIVAIDTDDDLALLRVEGEGLEPLPLAAADPPAGSDVFILSHPANHYYVFTRGMVSRLSRSRHGHRVQLEVTAPYARGSSGAAIVDRAGNVVGVVKSTRSIYYQEKSGGHSESLQMVLRMTVPVSEVRALLTP